MVTASRSLKVLIVEDNPDTAETFQALFRVEGHEAFIARDGLEAVEFARTRPVDVVLCDLGLPKMNGFEVVRTLRSDPAVPYLPVCAVTARSDEQSRRQAAAAGFDGYIVKPPRFPELLSFLKRYQQ